MAPSQAMQQKAIKPSNQSCLLGRTIKAEDWVCASPCINRVLATITSEVANIPITRKCEKRVALSAISRLPNAAPVNPARLQIA